MDIFDLVDIQRVRHSQLRRYPYESKSLGVKSRIDFFLVAKNLQKYVKTIGIYPAIAPDHKAIRISLLCPKEDIRGPGFWKFNNTLLKDDNFVTTVRDVYTKTCELKSQINDKRLFWELLKMEIRAATIVFAKRKAKTNYKEENEIKRQLDILDNIICNNFQHPDIDNILDKYSELKKKQFESIYDQKGKAAMFRSKCRWLEKGERPTKYFFNLEKRNYNKKTVTELKTDRDTTIKDEKQILDEIESYYNNLYTTDIIFSHTAYSEYIEKLQIPRLSEEAREKCEGPLTFEECKKSLETFQNEKSPGEDGFTIEFDQFFFELGNDLIENLNAAFVWGELSISQRRGIITLLPKEDGSLLEVSNWRPITLLNTDYKIASKAIAKRIEAVL